MKLILVAGATLLTACAAFGFARAVDQLTALPQVAAPSPAGFGTERVIPAAPVARAAIPAPAPVESAARDVDPAPAPPAPRLAVAPQPVARESDDNAMYFVPPKAAPGLDVAKPVRRYDFANLPVIGVYR